MSTSNKDAENANILEEIDYGKEHLESEGSDEGNSTFSLNPYQSKPTVFTSQRNLICTRSQSVSSMK